MLVHYHDGNIQYVGHWCGDRLVAAVIYMCWSSQVVKEGWPRLETIMKISALEIIETRLL